MAPDQERHSVYSSAVPATDPKTFGESDAVILHAHDWLVYFAANELKHAYKLPLVATIHATEYGRNQGIHNEMQGYINSIEEKLRMRRGA